MTQNNKGLPAALGAFILWGLLPLYWKSLDGTSSIEIICHRIIWSTIVTWLLLILSKKAGNLCSVIKDKKVLLCFVLSSLLLSANWLLYIWAVNQDYIVETSLGYYINPLINVLFGVFFFQERLRRMQWLAIFFAFIGVCYLTFIYGQFPWIAMALAVSFGLYGLLRKKATLPSIEGLALETTIVLIPALIIFFFLAGQGQSDFVQQDNSVRFLLAGAGIVTTLPLLLFGFAAQRLPLSTLGIVQYIAPTIQLCIGIFVYGEAFPREQMIGFMMVWSGLVVYATEGIIMRVKRKKIRLDT